MNNQYNIIISNGSGTENVLNGNYSVTSQVTGYLDTSIDPSTLNVVEGTNTYDLKISAEGTLTLHVTETGESTGTAIQGAKFIRCDADGNTYGTEIETDVTGNVSFENVPYDANNAPLIYYKQTATSGNHEFDSSLKNISLESITKTVEVSNPLAALRTFTLKDANYEGLSIASGNITLS